MGLLPSAKRIVSSGAPRAAARVGNGSGDHLHGAADAAGASSVSLRQKNRPRGCRATKTDSGRPRFRVTDERSLHPSDAPKESVCCRRRRQRTRWYGHRGKGRTVRTGTVALAEPAKMVFSGGLTANRTISPTFAGARSARPIRAGEEQRSRPGIRRPESMRCARATDYAQARRDRDRSSALRAPLQPGLQLPRRLPARLRILLQARHLLITALAAARRWESLQIAAIMLLAAPSNARLPVTISYSTSPKRVDVAARIGFLAVELLRRHVLQRAHDHAVAWVTGAVVRVVRRCRGLHLCQPEVEQLHAGLGHQNVARLQIPMRDASCMRRVERIADLPGVLQRLVERQRAFERRPSMYSITR